MNLELLIVIVLCAGSAYGGYWLRAHMHAVADQAAAAVKDAVNKVVPPTK